jgi:hypothetical protein
MRNIIALALTVGACGTTPSSSTAGIPFAVEDSAVMVRTNRRLANIDFTDFADACSGADEREHPNSQTFRFLLADLDADAPPAAPGTYPIYTVATFPLKGLAARCGHLMFDSTCRTPILECTSGTVTLTRVDPQGYAGQFDVVIDNKRVVGMFDSPACPDVSESGFGICQ